MSWVPLLNSLFYWIVYVLTFPCIGAEIPKSNYYTFNTQLHHFSFVTSIPVLVLNAKLKQVHLTQILD